MESAKSNYSVTDILLLTASVGLVFIIAYSSILEKPRRWLKDATPFLRELLSCSQCLGVWCGAFVAFPYLLMIEPSLWMVLFKTFLWSMTVSLIAPIVDMSMDILGAYLEKILSETEEIHKQKELKLTNSNEKGNGVA